jgi:phosphodiesterase/alkaline phosphatase D-like protein
MSTRRTTILALAAATALLWGTATAQAAFLTPEHQYTFKGTGEHEMGDIRALAVDQATHTLYVADRTNHRVVKFDLLGNFILMFGDGVNETTGGNVCPVAPTDHCRPGQQSSPTFPHFDNPTALAVDNSGGASQGAIYVADQVGEGGDGSVSKFAGDGSLITSWGEGGRKYLNPFKMGVSPYTGYLWVIDWNYQIVNFDPNGTEAVRVNQPWNIGTEGDLIVDEQDRVYYSSYGGVMLKGDLTQLQEEGQLIGQVYSGSARRWAINPVNGDIYIGFGNRIVVLDKSCNPALGYCPAKQQFGTGGKIVGGDGVAVDAASGSVYDATNNGVAYFKPKVVPDVLSAGPPSTGHTEATLSAHVDPLGAGNVIACKLEWGETASYGNEAPCDQTLPLSSAQNVTAEISGLTTESDYHYRFVVENGNGAWAGADRVVTPHWVRNIATGDATDVGPGAATLNGVLDPNGESTHYYFEWGTTTAYGNVTPSETGTEINSGPGNAAISVSLAGELTSQTTYHYRLVAYNDFGTSTGEDRTFTTPIADLPQITSATVTDVGMTSATLGGEVSPGFGDTSFTVQYGPDTDYGSRTVISDSIGNDGSVHPVSIEVEELVPGATYHFRVVAFNFKGTVQGPDGTFTTADLPGVLSSSSSVLSPTSARLSSAITANGVSGPTSVRFEYGTSAAYGSLSSTVPLSASGGTAEAEIGGLTPGTTYHFRAVASNPFGDVGGPDQTFVTPPAPQEATPPPPTPCKKGQVRKKGKCVKKKHKKKKRKHKKKRRGGGAR